jgi:hypothetical protein
MLHKSLLALTAAATIGAATLPATEASALVSRLASLALFLARELSLASALCLAPALCLASPLAARLIRRGNIAPARRHLPAGAITAS